MTERGPSASRVHLGTTGQLAGIAVTLEELSDVAPAVVMLFVYGISQRYEIREDRRVGVVDQGLVPRVEKVGDFARGCVHRDQVEEDVQHTGCPGHIGVTWAHRHEPQVRLPKFSA